MKKEDLRSEAGELLDRGLRGVLAAYGEVVVHGSFLLDTMTRRDLDLYLVVPEFDLRRFFELGFAAAALLAPHRMQFRDERAASGDELPRGLYWGVHPPAEPPGGWKIDIWAVTAAEAARRMRYEEQLARALTPELRAIVLEIKAAVSSRPGYGRSFGSRDVYDAILAGGVRSLADFEAHLASRRRE